MLPLSQFLGAAAQTCGAATPVLFACSPAQPSGQFFAQAAKVAAATAAAAAATTSAGATTLRIASVSALGDGALPRGATSAAAATTAATAAWGGAALQPVLTQAAPLNQQSSLDGHWATGSGTYRGGAPPAGALMHKALASPGAPGAKRPPLSPFAAAAVAVAAAGPNTASVSSLSGPVATAAAAAAAALSSSSHTPAVSSPSMANGVAMAPAPTSTAAPVRLPSDPSRSGVLGAAANGAAAGPPVDRFWNIRWNELQGELVALIGSGSYGQVSLRGWGGLAGGCTGAQLAGRQAGEQGLGAARAHTLGSAAAAYCPASRPVNGVCIRLLISP